ncbi:transketolase [Herbaspirillum huttiense F1]|uniref:Transketolase n=1 Tax=Herbaspirillum huttiense subsp. lycopersici TaxID=3074428 RepID=A0ABU2ES34_9BURK|nr:MULTISPECIES: transketolase [Herbaspirillum]MDR6742572.1 transketolase [Herbaspirillum sp. 1173]MDR9850982.1 transketolase [Herbaspirillum huttiense SE1]MDT0359118.1 transketolase [Herbaspirillum huttiense F1]
MAQDITALKKTASQLRGRIIENAHRTQTPHLGSCLSCVDILTAAYFSTLRIDPSRPADPLRDRFILSKGHGAAALFQVLALRGFYPIAMLDDYGKDGGIFAEHPPTPDHLPGIEAATGSLGHGLPIGLGMALAGRIQQQRYDVTVLLGDGECNEGSVWEAAMMAAAQRTGNLMVLVDFNKWQATGRSEEVLALNPLVDKWRAFGWDAMEIDGHDMATLVEIMGRPRAPEGKPIAVVAHTVKGKGVSFMEDDNNWHYRIPNADEVAAAYQELGAQA